MEAAWQVPGGDWQPTETVTEQDGIVFFDDAPADDAVRNSYAQLGRHRSVEAQSYHREVIRTPSPPTPRSRVHATHSREPSDTQASGAPPPALTLHPWVSS